MKSLSAFVTAFAMAGWMSPAAAMESPAPPAIPAIPPVPPAAAAPAEAPEAPEEVTETETKDENGRTTKTIIRTRGTAKGGKGGKGVEKKRNVRVFAVEGAKITREETADGYVMRVVLPKSSKEGKSMMDMPADDGTGESVYVFSNKAGLVDMSDRNREMVIRVPEIPEMPHAPRARIEMHEGGDVDDLREQLKETSKALEKMNEQMKKMREEMAKMKK